MTGPLTEGHLKSAEGHYVQKSFPVHSKDADGNCRTLGRMKFFCSIKIADNVDLFREAVGFSTNLLILYGGLGSSTTELQNGNMKTKKESAISA